MAIPDYQQFLLPFLKLASDGQIHSLQEAYQSLPDQFHLTTEENNALLPSGKQSIVNNRIGWARTYLKKANLIKQPKRGVFQITEQGKKVLEINLKSIDKKYLMQFAEFQEFVSKKSDEEQPSQNIKENPEELLEYAFEEIKNSIFQDILEAVKNTTPAFFEKLIIDLLLKMGYGGSRRDAGQAIGKTGDEGIDGIINEDKLGLSVIYIQAKKWENVIGRPEIQKFAGALQGKRARKGIFITTSSFTKEALEYAANIENKIILVDGKTLVKYMYDYNIGVSPSCTYQIKKLDSDYFEE